MNTARTFTARTIATAAVAALMLPLGGCSLLPTAGPVQPTPDAVETVEPVEETPEPVETQTSSGGLSFADGATLQPGTQIQWADGMVLDDGWTLTSPDDGNGNWGYTSADGTCTVAFWQGLLDGLPLSGDDAVDSDGIIAVALDVDTSQITEVADDTQFSYQTAGAGGLDARSVVGQEGERSWAIIARAFSTANVGVRMVVDCTGGDVAAAFQSANGLNAVAIF